MTCHLLGVEMRDHRSKLGFLVVILLLAITTNSSYRGVSADKLSTVGNNGSIGSINLIGAWYETNYNARAAHECGATEGVRCIGKIGGKLSKA